MADEIYPSSIKHIPTQGTGENDNSKKIQGTSTRVS